MMPSEEEFINGMKRLNIKLTDTVICYDGGPMNLFGFRAAWMFNTMGHPSVYVLDGGFAAWVKEGKEVESSDASASAGNFAYKLNPAKIVSFE